MEKTRWERVDRTKLFFSPKKNQNLSEDSLKALAIFQLSYFMIENFWCTDEKTIMERWRRKLIEISQTILRVANAVALSNSSDRIYRSARPEKERTAHVLSSYWFIDRLGSSSLISLHTCQLRRKKESRSFAVVARGQIFLVASDALWI